MIFAKSLKKKERKEEEEERKTNQSLDSPQTIEGNNNLYSLSELLFKYEFLLILKNLLEELLFGLIF